MTALSDILSKTTLEQAEQTLERLQNEVAMWEVIVSAIRARDGGKKRRKPKTDNAPDLVLTADPIDTSQLAGVDDWQAASHKCGELSMRAVQLIGKHGDKAKEWGRSITALAAELNQRKSLRPDDVEMMESIEREIKAAEG